MASLRWASSVSLCDHARELFVFDPAHLRFNKANLVLHGAKLLVGLNAVRLLTVLHDLLLLVLEIAFHPPAPRVLGDDSLLRLLDGAYLELELLFELPDVSGKGGDRRLQLANIAIQLLQPDKLFDLNIHLDWSL